MIRILIVDDLRTQREFLKYLFSSQPDMEVVGMAENGALGAEMACALQPDVITMDIHMPVMNGYDATRLIMKTCARPIVIVTASWAPEDVRTSMRALEAGAVTALEKPYGFGHALHEESVRHLIETVRLMSEVRVVTRSRHSRKPGAVAVPPSRGPQATIKIVVIGVSTGGPPVLREMLSSFAADFPVPILIVQHISKGFLSGMRDWLQESSQLPIHIPKTGERARPGNVYLAPDDFQMAINDDDKIVLEVGDAEHGLRPSVSYLFRHAASYGRHAIGCLLTGMGRDGAEELGLMRTQGAITFAQDEASSVVFGMPGEAVRRGAASYIMPPAEIAAKINELVASGR